MFDKKKAAAMMRSAMHHAAYDSDRPDGLAIEFARLSRNRNQIALYVIRGPSVPDRFGHTGGAVFYVGQTRKPRRRILQHLASGVRGQQSRRGMAAIGSACCPAASASSCCRSGAPAACPKADRRLLHILRIAQLFPDA
jgi:hypothetical protein